jgi:hypothetical protein
MHLGSLDANQGRLAMAGTFGPWHDRLELTSEENRIIARLERAMTPPARRRLASDREVRSVLNLSSRLLLLCLCFRKRAIWLVPLGTVGVALTLSASFPAAACFALLWCIGLTAAISEITVRIQNRHQA